MTVAGARHADSGKAGYAARRTLPLRVEALRQLRRRRTLIAFGLLMILPWIIAIAFELNGGSDGGGNGNNGNGTYGLGNAATTGAMNFTLFTLFVSAGFLLVVMVALFCGDTVASEANWSSLRYLLAAPVPRARLLRQKLVIALLFAAVALISLPLMALLTGTVFFGWHDVTLPAGGGTYPLGTALTRMAVIIGYSLIANLVVAALAFLLSVVTDSPLGAVGGAVGLVIISNILDSVTALGHKRDFLPTHWTYAWLDVLQPNIQWAGMIKGTAISVSYALIFLALAFRRFGTKDIVS